MLEKSVAKLQLHLLKVSWRRHGRGGRSRRTGWTGRHLRRYARGKRLCRGSRLVIDFEPQFDKVQPLVIGETEVLFHRVKITRAHHDRRISDNVLTRSGIE